MTPNSKPVVLAKEKTTPVVNKVKPHVTPEVGVFLLELHAVSREIPYFYIATGILCIIFSGTVYCYRRFF